MATKSEVAGWTCFGMSLVGGVVFLLTQAIGCTREWELKKQEVRIKQLELAEKFEGNVMVLPESYR